MISQGTEGRLTSLQLPRTSFFHLLKMGLMVPLFQVLQISPMCHDVSDLMDSDLGTSSDGYLGHRSC